MNTLTKHCFSWLHNTSEELDDSVKVEELDKYMQELKLSGYTESERLKILKGGINTYKNIKRLEINNVRPFYRSNSFQKTERMENKSKKKKHWFKGRNCDLRYKSVMFVEATPEDTLLKMLKTTEEQHKISDNHRIKFVSKSGSKLENILERKNPFESNCHSNDCKPCANSNLKTNQLSKCRTNNVSYESTCKLCEKEGRQRVYIGETARNLYTRSKEHYRDLKNNVQTSWMLKHINAEHAGIKEGVEFTWKVIEKHSKPLQRQLKEAVRIKNSKIEESLNSKMEFNGQRIQRVSLEKSQKEFICNICGNSNKTVFELQEHKERFHIRKNCEFCDYIAYGQSGIKEHMKTSHTAST